MSLPQATYGKNNNFATIPGSQVMQQKQKLSETRSNSKLNKTKVSSTDQNALDVNLPVINKGKRLAQIDDDNYEEDFEEVSRRQVKTTKRANKQLSEEQNHENVKGDSGNSVSVLKNKNKSVTKVSNHEQRSRSIGGHRDSTDESKHASLSVKRHQINNLPQVSNRSRGSLDEASNDVYSNN